MSYSTDSYTQEDTCTFPVYQRLRKINPYAYYFLDAQKQMQQDLREAGSLVFLNKTKMHCQSLMRLLVYSAFLMLCLRLIK